MQGRTSKALENYKETSIKVFDGLYPDFQLGAQRRALIKSRRDCRTSRQAASGQPLKVAHQQDAIALQSVGRTFQL
jgi:hypothetical protein